jgi:hypothetical protein
MKIKISIALLLAVAPALAFARPREATAHVRTQSFHDRTPKARVHEARAHHA